MISREGKERNGRGGAEGEQRVRERGVTAEAR